MTILTPGPNGAIPRLGGIVRTYAALDFNGTALPAGASVPSGTATFAALPTAVGSPSGDVAAATGNVRVTSGAVSGNEGIIQADAVLRTASYRLIRARVEGLRFDSNNPVAGFYVRLRGSSGMLTFSQEHSEPTAKIVRPGNGGNPGNGNLATQANILAAGTNRGTRRHNIELGLSHPLKEGYLRIGDSEPFVFACPEVFDHNVRFQVGVITREATTHWLEVSRMTVVGEHY